MKAWQYERDGAPLALNEVPEPVAGPGEVLIDVKASGICHSDIGYLDGTISNLLPGGPVTLGHEIAGIVSDRGEGVTTTAVGDRVAIKADLLGPGCGRDGGFAPKVAVQAEFLVPIPEGVSWDQAAVSTDGGMTSFHAVTVRGQVTTGDRVGIIGFGGLGSLGLQIALGLGAEVFVADTKESLFPQITEAGASGVANTIGDFTDVGLDVVIDFAGYGTTTAEAITAVRHGGRVVQVGLGVSRATIDVNDLTLREIELVGSLGGTVEDNEQVLDMMARGALASRTTLIEFDGVAEAIERLRRGENSGRFVMLNH
ncbi:zinc-binding dehydrogenase [Arthrobacter sp. FW305-BF8]|uniref:zinc-binding dehydrogenase n=1 Tax=Arthrobacter sp. FW305-BF8 TaxID=2879617 RepID=UPI001F1B0239|nr:zinc-binding dehydrogenase [Arthrobacter sp. FW305-BF8]UKA55197.1 zinc-binding dehydrogenase [Arthrobacter sp. FW305-BF8]